VRKTYYVYILTNDSGTLYIGVTNDIERRIGEHRLGTVPGFTLKYRLRRVVYVEETNDVHEALAREKQLKKWRREKKIALVNTINPDWRDLMLSP
jgi:putative endonuclease